VSCPLNKLIRNRRSNAAAGPFSSQPSGPRPVGCFSALLAAFSLFREGPPPCHPEFDFILSKTGTSVRRGYRTPRNHQYMRDETLAPARNDRTGNDMSASTISLTLLLLATIAAVHSDHPTFWLLIGPVPLASGLTALTFLRRK
jgi:hypothetical protein